MESNNNAIIKKPTVLGTNFNRLKQTLVPNSHILSHLNPAQLTIVYIIHVGPHKTCKYHTIQPSIETVDKVHHINRFKLNNDEITSFSKS